MSRPANPLEPFRTYAYHFVLAIAQDTAAARAWLETPQFDVVPANKRGPSTLSLEQRFPLTENGRICVLLNSKTDSHFVISEFKQTNMLVPQGGGPAGDTHALFNADAEMQIVEPRGIDFMNVVRDVHGRMGRDPSGTVFCLQIQFVGHRDDGSEGPLEVELVGVQLKLADLTAKFDVQGGTYDLIMFGIANGVTRTGHTVKALDQAQLPTNGSLKLEIALRELQDNINENYNARFKKETMRRGHPPGGKVQYAFLAGDYTGCDMDEHLSNQTDSGDAKRERGNYQFGKSTNVDVGIKDLAEFCKKILNDKDNSKERHFVPNVVSVELSGEDAKNLGIPGVAADADYVYIYKLIRHEQSLQTNDLRAAATRQDLPANNFIEFDYFYTGKNIDVLDFEMKMNMGLSFIANVATTPSIPERGSGNTNANESAPGTGTTLPMDSRATKDPWLPAQATTSHKPSNKRNSESAIKNRAAIAKAAGWEMIQASMKITGNPSLLANLNPDPRNLIFGEREKGRGDYGVRSAKTPQSDVNKDWPGIKGFVKVNIRSMRTGEDDSTTTAQFQSEPFWYDGFYEIVAIENSFSSGEFTQTLDIMSLPFHFDTDAKEEDRPSQADMEMKRIECGNTDTDKQENSPTQSQPPDQAAEE